jgi:hypothetical protein
MDSILPDTKMEKNAYSEEADLYIDEEMFAILRERREAALKGVSDYNPFVNRTKTSLYEKIKVRVKISRARRSCCLLSDRRMRSWG